MTILLGITQYSTYKRDYVLVLDHKGSEALACRRINVASALSEVEVEVVCRALRIEPGNALVRSYVSIVDDFQSG